MFVNHELKENATMWWILCCVQCFDVMLYTVLVLWFQIFLNVHAYLGKIPFLTYIFQMGWNHQLDTVVW